MNVIYILCTFYLLILIFFIIKLHFDINNQQVVDIPDFMKNRHYEIEKIERRQNGKI